ncbi:amino acid ABC transporter permease [Mesorhizobium sp. CA8]|uniref:amino acid ABC transporter permease n=1 Tax=unclassified Mesorhizobium TaxID=325217 RepID=UPI001CCF3266|nr:MULTISPECIES: amino acid ABC transporter permease [unclassified Mesorhizobium]MBZ9761788.1 amino acid ABC transporter permease [Mesorhizobium sp. CA8]MBZ9823300.1 amino acid ABC transporter permease [Mesorhizobium sp. CA4]
MLTIVQDHWSFLLWGQFPDGPIGGLALTIVIAVMSLAITFPFAVCIALARTSGLPMLHWLSTGYVYVVRGLPILTFLLWLYFLLPLLLPFSITPFWTLLAAIVIYQSAYLSEVIRAGIEGLPPGQTEAARSLGMSWFIVTRKVVLPQALYDVLPGILNQFTIIIKESSLGSVIALNELTFQAAQVDSFLVTKSLSIYCLIALVYFMICFSLSYLVKNLENRIANKRGATLTGPDNFGFA